MCLSAYNVSRCYFLTRHLLYRVVRFILAAVGAKGASVTIVFVTDDKIRRLNALYRGVRRATDVLAFSMKEGKCVKGDSSFLGDIIISVDRARANAKRFGTTFKNEIYLYLIHGILHLIGYDDETPASRIVMQRRQIELLRKLCEKIR